MTRSIADGQPEKECLNELFEDVFSNSKSLCIGMGAVLILSVFCQIGLCGGMPGTDGESDAMYAEGPSNNDVGDAPDNTHAVMQPSEPDHE